MLNHPVAVNPHTREVLPKGTPVRVRNTLGSWAGGFEVESLERSGYRLRRVSDGAVLPRAIGASEVKKG